MSEPKLSPSIEQEFKKWRRNLKEGEEFNLLLTKSRPTATEVHVWLTKYPEAALRLYWLCTIFNPNWYQSFFVSKALGEYFARYLELPVEVFEKKVKPAYRLTQLENMVKDYCKIVKKELNREVLAVIYYDWEKERDIVHRVKVFLENTFKGGYTDITKHELEEIRELQAKIHYGLFGEILDLYSDFSLQWFTQKLHDKKFRRKLDNLTKIVSKAEKVTKDIQQSKEKYLK